MTPATVHGANAARHSAPKNGRGVRDIDRGLLTCFILLMMIGLATLYAASYYNAQDKGSAFSEVASQLMGVAVGMVGMLLILHIDYRWLAKPWICGGLLAASFIMLILVAIPGVGRMLNGSRRWLRLGRLPVPRAR